MRIFSFLFLKIFALYQSRTDPSLERATALNQSLVFVTIIRSEVSTLMTHVALWSPFRLIHFLSSNTPCPSIVLNSPGFQNCLKQITTLSSWLIATESLLLKWPAYNFWRGTPQVSVYVKRWIAIVIHTSTLGTDRMVPSLFNPLAIPLACFQNVPWNLGRHWSAAVSKRSGNLLCSLREGFAGGDRLLNQ